MIANLHIQTKQRNGITYLKEAYFTPPFKLADIREDKNDKILQLMLMSSSPGILDGDEYHVQIDLDDYCSLRITTQSYQRLFSMKGHASQHLVVRMGRGSAFCYLPHPTVPHQDSDFTSKNIIYLSGKCSLIWGEILTCGRKQNGEVFLFSKYHNLTEVYLHGKLIIKENLMLQPSVNEVNIIGQLESYTHQASLIYLNEHVDADCLKQTVSAFLTGQTQITYGITETPQKGILVRILGCKGEQLYNCLVKITEIINLIKHPIPAYA